MRNIGIIVGVLGALLLVVSLLADTLKIGGAPLYFGWKQIVGVMTGTILFLIGFILCLPRKENHDNNTLC